MQLLILTNCLRRSSFRFTFSKPSNKNYFVDFSSKLIEPGQTILNVRVVIMWIISCLHLFSACFSYRTSQFQFGESLEFSRDLC